MPKDGSGPFTASILLSPRPLSPRATRFLVRCMCVYLRECVCHRLCTYECASKEEHEREKEGLTTRCQTFSDFPSTTNLIGSCDAQMVKGEQDWRMPAGVEQEVGRAWLGIFGMRQEFWHISPYRTLSWNHYVCVDTSV